MKARWSVLTALVCGLLASGSVHAVTLEEIQAAIQQRGAAWTAGENSIWNRPLSDRRGLVGTILEGNNADVPAATSELQALPGSFDWRSQAMVTPVKDQGQCGSCWAFAAVGALESSLLVNQAVVGVVPDLSEQFVVSYNLTNHGCNGGSLGNVSNFLQKVGDPLEECKPYAATSRKLPRPCQEWRDQAAGIGAWGPVAKDVNALKAAVYQGPVATGFYVFEDFYAYTGGVYTHVSGELLGGHAILVVGWDDADQCFIVKNSWGPDWGESGYFRIAYSQMLNEVDFGADSVAYVNPWTID